MFEVHGWLELCGAENDGELSGDEAAHLDEALGRVAATQGREGERSRVLEWENGLLTAFWSNGHRYVHFARLWNHREPGEAAVRALVERIWRAVRGTRGRIDVVDHERQGEAGWCEVWWFENGELEAAPAEADRYARWFA